MAITRRLNEIQISFDGVGNPAVTATGLITDDQEGTVTGRAYPMTGPLVKAAAEALRDAVMNAAATAGKPLTF